jgi:hypothetical protein
VRATDLDAVSLADAAVGLLRDDGARNDLRGRLVELDLRNGIEVALDGIARLLPADRAAG